MKTKTLTLMLSTAMCALVMLLAPVALTTNLAHAQTNPTTTCTGGDCTQKGLGDIRQSFPVGATQAQDVPTLVRKVINWALYLAAIIAVIFIIIGGFRYMFAQGNDTKAAEGRKTMTNALIGLVIIVLSYLLVQVIYNFLVH